MKGTIAKIGVVKKGSFWNTIGDSDYGDFSKMPEVGAPFIFYAREPWCTSIVKKVEEKSENEWIITTTYSVYELTIEPDD